MLLCLELLGLSGALNGSPNVLVLCSILKVPGCSGAERKGLVSRLGVYKRSQLPLIPCPSPSRPPVVIGGNGHLLFEVNFKGKPPSKQADQKPPDSFHPHPLELGCSLFQVLKPCPALAPALALHARSLRPAQKLQ